LPLPTNTFYVGETILEATDIASERYPNMKEVIYYKEVHLKLLTLSMQPNSWRLIKQVADCDT
jgi:hypothetical protein